MINKRSAKREILKDFRAHVPVDKRQDFLFILDWFINLKNSRPELFEWSKGSTVDPWQTVKGWVVQHGQMDDPATADKLKNRSM